MKNNLNILVVAGLVSGPSTGLSQGFVNLDFESAKIAVDSTSSLSFQVYANKALPGWTPYICGVAQQDVIYNTVPLSEAAVTIQDTNNGYIPSVSGRYFVMLWGQFNPTGVPDYYTNSAAIGQTGQIPSNTRSLEFWGSMGGMQITFNGQTLNFTVTGSTANYSIYTANISAFAGQNGLLLFADPGYSNTFGGPGTVDHIQFSSSSVPESGVLSLVGLGALAFGWRRGRRRCV